MRSSSFRVSRLLVSGALVALVALPLAPGVGGAAGPPGGQNVLVLNDPSEPVPVVAVEPVPVVPAGPSADGEPFQILLAAPSMQFAVGANSQSTTFEDLVPEGKRAVIEFVSLTTSFASYTSTDERSCFLRVRTEEAGTPGSVARLGVGFRKAGGSLGGSQPVLLYVEHDQSLHLTIGRTNNDFAEQFYVQLTGRLVDAD